MVNKHKPIVNQQGFASIVIAIILVLVLSLITVGFAQLMRQNQTQATDKQLNSQAYYAAESGINVAEQAINAGFSANKTDCAPYTPAGSTPLPADTLSATVAQEYLENNTVGTPPGTVGSTGASYPCLLIDPAPTTIQFGSIPTNQSDVLEMTGVASDGTTPDSIHTILISWQKSGTDKLPAFRPGGSTSFPPVTSWGSTEGVLHIAFTPLQNSSDVNRKSLANLTDNFFLYPAAGTSVATATYAPYSSAGDVENGGSIVSGNCSSGHNSYNGQPTAYYCATAITFPGGEANIILDLRSVYNNSNVTITAYDANNTQLRIKNAQYLIDSTGKAQGELKRIQVRLPAANNYPEPFGVETGICKQLSIYPSGGADNCPAP